jgi:hypothetical protein
VGAGRGGSNEFELPDEPNGFELPDEPVFRCLDGAFFLECGTNTPVTTAAATTAATTTATTMMVVRNHFGLAVTVGCG